MKFIQGNLLEIIESGMFDVVVHGCNCFCNMGGGIAFYLKAKYPEILAIDKKTSCGDRGKLGSCSAVTLKNNVIVLNAYTQYHWKGSDVLVDYSALRKVFRKIKSNFSGKRIVYPKIGAGLANGDWGVIEKIISEELFGESHTCVLYKEGTE